MKKAPEAFRTISEVAEILETPAHVLRFWESKFYQIRPVKRAGGRRYYRPDDVALINGIRNLLQDQGMTIRGVQRVLQEEGAKHVATLGGPIRSVAESDNSDTLDGIPDVAAAEVQNASDPYVATEISADEEPFFDAHQTYGDSDLDDAEVEHSEIEDAEIVPEPVPAPQEMLAEKATPAASEPETIDAVVETDEMAESEASEPIPTPVEPIPDPVSIAAAQSAAQPDSGKSPEKPTAPAPSHDLDEDDTQRISDRASLARGLRVKPRGQLGKDVDSYARLGRRIDALLERMSEASGAGRW